jgi:phytoene/squalene synthetase
MHSDQCREFIHAHSPDFHLATEFIESLDPEREDRVWQRFQSPEDIEPLLKAWLAGEEMPTTTKPAQPPVIPANRLKPTQNLGAVLKNARDWVEENRARLASLPALEAIEEVLARLELPRP